MHVGRGVGCGIVTGGRRVSGAHHAAGEIGHVTVGTDGGEDCPCGKRGCLETWLSIPRLRAALDSPDGHEVVEAGGERLGVALAPIVAALDLSEVVLAGPEELLGPVLPVLERTLAAAPARGPRCPAVRPARRITRRTSSCAAQRRWSSGTSSGSSDPDRHHPLHRAHHHQHQHDSTTTAPPTTRTRCTPGPTGPTARKEDRMIRRLPIVALTSAALVLTACASGGDSSDTPAATELDLDNAGKTITLWLAGGDTPDELRTYLTDTFKAKTGATLKIEEQAWPDLVTKLTTVPARRREHPGRRRARQHPVADLHQRRRLPRHLRPVRRARRRQAAPVLRRGRLGRRQEVRPAVLLRLALHVHAQGRLEGGRRRTRRPPSTSSTPRSRRSRQENPRDIKNFSGFFIGGQDWRNGISWIFANGGDLAKKENGQWVSTLSDPNTPQGPAAAAGDPEDREQRAGRRQGPDAVALHQRHRRDHRRRRQGHRQDLPRRRDDHGAGLGALVDR